MQSDTQNEFYFAYASDLMEQRVRKGSSSAATSLGPASLAEHMFEYAIESPVWRGGVADLVPAPPPAVAWGLLYKFPKADIPKLDKQKGISSGDPKYKKVFVTVRLASDQAELAAFTYVLHDAKRIMDGSTASGAKRFPPSVQYRNCIVKGARQAGLPASYVALLEGIEDNGETFKRKSVGKACD